MMLHVRVVSPPQVTARLLGELSTADGVHNLVILPGAAKRPDGDAIQFDLAPRSANPVFRHLRSLQLDRQGAITVDRIAAALTRANAERPLGEIGSPAREAAPVWEMVEATIRGNATYPPSFFILLIIAGLIGAVGILTNSQILIVGAMVVGPEYDAIIAVALGSSTRDRRATRDGVLALTLGFLAAIVATLLFGLVIRATGHAPRAFLAGVRPVADLINTPNVFSAIVAVLAGLVGVVSLTEARANALIGVFISVTTIPAAASVGVSLAFSSWSEARGSLYQLLLNVVVLIGVGAFGLNTQRAIWRRWARRGTTGVSPGVSPGGGEADPPGHAVT
jgi:uncharacterized hydrophobic protein (TIGR00271 family)